MPEPTADALSRKLRSVARRVKLLGLLRGLLSTAAVAAACLLLLAAIDWQFTFHGNGIRTFLWAGAIAAVALTAAATIAKPLARKLPPTQVARALESSHPELGESLSTALHLSRNDRLGTAAAAGSLGETVLRDAEAGTREIRVSKEAPAKRMRPALLSAAALAIAGGGAFWLWPEVSSDLLERAVMPMAGGGNIHARNLAVTPGDTRIPAGDTLHIEVELAGAEAATVRRRVPGGADAVERMSPIPVRGEDGGARFVLSIPAIEEPFEYRIQCGRALTRYFAVDVAPRPEVVDRPLVYRYPSYTGLADSEGTWDEEVVAPAGTVVELTATLATPVKRATLIADGAPLWDNRQSLSEDGRPTVTWEFVLVDGTDGTLGVQLESSDGLANEPVEVPLRALPDRAPTVEITSPSATIQGLTVLPADILPIRFLAREDYRISTAQLIVQADGQLLPPRELPPPAETANEGVFSGSTMLDLGALDLDDGATLEVRVGVADNNPDGPGAGLSEPLVLTVDSRSQSLLAQKITLSHTELHDSIWAAMEKLAEARPLSNGLAGQLANGGAPPKTALAKLENIAGLAASAASLAGEAAGRAEGSPFESISPALEKIVRDQLERARAAAEAVPLMDREEARVHQARVAQRSIEEASAELGEVLRDLKQIADRERIAAELGEIEERRQQLAEKGEDTGPLDELANKLLEAGAKSLAEQLGDAEGLASELAGRAAELAKDQERLAKLMELADDLGAREQLVTELMEWLSEEQSGIAERAAELAKQFAGNTDLEAAAEQATEAAGALAKGMTPEAAKAVAESAGALENLPAELGRELAGLAPELADLADWQRRIAEQAEAFAGGDIEAALSGMQGDIAELAAELAAESGDFEQLIQALADPDTAMRAVEALRSIAESANRAGDASGQLEGLSPDFAAALEALAETDEDLRAAAEALAAASSSLGREAGAPVSENAPEPVTPEAALRRREELLAGGDWSTSGGGTDTGLAAGARGEPPARYREMVNRYFEAIAAAEAAAEAAAGGDQ